ncbi:MAG: alpha/beta hydrolase [Proteobacteria bacterium]|nr:alpha/beta hydrolase [Pseudomonadota bacterium]
MTQKPIPLPESQELLASQSKTWAGLTSIEERRAAWRTYAATMSRPVPENLRVNDAVVPAPEFNVPVRIYRHRDAESPLPCIMYMHGGGFMMGDLDTSDSVAWGLADLTGAQVVSVDYRLTPEHPFPAAFNDSWAVLCHIHANPELYDADPNRLAVAGDSAGAKLSAGLSLKARDTGEVSLKAVAMIYGNGGFDIETESARIYAEGYGLTSVNSKKYAAMLFPDNRYDDDPYAWPIRATSHANLAPTLVHTAEMDPGRDSARQYAAKLVMAGVVTTYRDAKGLVHGFMRSRFTGPASKIEFAEICAFLRHHLFPVSS